MTRYYDDECDAAAETAPGVWERCHGRWDHDMHHVKGRNNAEVMWPAREGDHRTIEGRVYDGHVAGVISNAVRDLERVKFPAVISGSTSMAVESLKHAYKKLTGKDM